MCSFLSRCKMTCIDCTHPKKIVAKQVVMIGKQKLEHICQYPPPPHSSLENHHVEAVFHNNYIITDCHSKCSYTMYKYLMLFLQGL